MGESHLDWKTAFKGILGKSPSSQNNVEPSEKSNNESSSHVSHPETQSSNESYSTLQLKNNSNNVPSGYRVNYHQSSVQRGSKTFSCNKSNIEDVKSHASIEESCSSSHNIQTNEVPEWKKVFKDILGNSSSTREELDEQNNVDFPLKKFPQKQYVPAHRRRFRRKQQSCSSSKKKMQEDMKEIREFLYRSSELTYDSSLDNYNNFAGAGVDLFKMDKKWTAPFKTETVSKTKLKDNFCDKYVKPDFSVTGLVGNIKPLTYDSSLDNYNNFAGAGVDLFKMDKKWTAPFKKETVSKTKLKDNFCDKYIKPDFSVTGLVGNIKPLTRADIADSPVFPITEWWDDDLMF